MACNLKFIRFVRHWIILPMAFDFKFKLHFLSTVGTAKWDPK
jgi:hypothetical protein